MTVADRRLAEWMSYWAMRVETTDSGSFPVEGRLKVYYESQLSGDTNHLYADLDSVRADYGGKVNVYIDVSGRDPTYWIKCYPSNGTARVEYDPRNSHGNKRLGSVTDIEWVETPAERTADRVAAIEDHGAFKECSHCDARTPANKSYCGRCGRGLAKATAVPLTESEEVLADA